MISVGCYGTLQECTLSCVVPALSFRIPAGFFYLCFCKGSWDIFECGPRGRALATLGWFFQDAGWHEKRKDVKTSWCGWNKLSLQSWIIRRNREKWVRVVLFKLFIDSNMITVANLLPGSVLVLTYLWTCKEYVCGL